MGEHVSLKWEMTTKNTFQAKKDGYTATVIIGNRMGVIWTILKGEALVDICYYHKPTDSELAGKVQVERVLQKIIETELGGNQTTKA